MPYDNSFTIASCCFIVFFFGFWAGQGLILQKYCFT